MDVPIANVWRGTNKRLAPHMISEQESPDSVNTDFKSGQVGILAGRKGASKLSDTAYSFPVLSLLPANFSGVPGVGGSGGSGAGGPSRLLVVDNGGNVTDEPQPYAIGGGGGWGGPTIVVPGFAAKAIIVSGATPKSWVGAYPVNGAKHAIATMLSGTFTGTTCTFNVYCSFDGGALQLALKCVATNSSGTISLTTTPYLMDCTGAVNLTGVTLTGIGSGTPQVGGTINIMGVGL